MAIVRPQDVAAYLTGKLPHQAVLVFGADAGLVSERAMLIALRSAENPDDPFSLVRMDADLLRGEPTRLIEEAMTVPMFGGRRAILLRAGTTDIAGAVAPLLQSDLAECRVVIEAGDLRRNAALRTLCEKSPRAGVIACYPDREREVGALVDEEMRAAGLAITRDARAALVSLLGGDRQTSRNELRKLALYAHGQAEVTLDDIAAVVADAQAFSLDNVTDAAFAGRAGDLDRALDHVAEAGTAPRAVLSAAARFALQLHRTRAAIESGTPTETALEAGFPRLHFSRKTLVGQAAQSWTAQRLLRVMQHIQSATLDTMQKPVLADAAMRRALLTIASTARARN